MRKDKSKTPLASTDEARTRAMIAGLEREILDYAVAAVASRGSHVVVACDPQAEFLGGPSDGVLELRSVLGSQPAAALMPHAVAERLVQKFAEISETAEARELLVRTRGPIDADCFRLMTICGGSIGLTVLRLPEREPKLINGLPLRATRDEFQEVEIRGEKQMVMTAAGALKWLLLVNPADFKESARRTQVERLHERARGAWAAESIRSNPRTLDEVMHATFNVQALKNGMRAQLDGKPDGAMRAIENLLESCVGGLS